MFPRFNKIEKGYNEETKHMFLRTVTLGKLVDFTRAFRVVEC